MIKKFRFKKVLCFALSLCTMFATQTVAFASSGNDAIDVSNAALEVKFKEFKYETIDYNINDVEIVYSETDTQEIAVIKEKGTDNVLEEIVVEKMNAVPFAARSTSLYTFRNTKSFGSTNVTLNVTVEMYSSGSFRQINSIRESYLGITSNITGMSIEDKTISVCSPGDVFPTTKVLFSYNGTLRADVDFNLSLNGNGEISAELIKAGFSVGGSTSTSVIYRRAMSHSGSFSLY